MSMPARYDGRWQVGETEGDGLLPAWKSKLGAGLEEQLIFSQFPTVLVFVLVLHRP